MDEDHRADAGELEPTLLAAASVSRGHFRYESGHHGDLWLELEQLFVDGRRVRAWVRRLAGLAAACRPDVVCGPLIGGAFVGQLLAEELGAVFIYAERFVTTDGNAHYQIPGSLRPLLRDQRVLLVDDAVNAGSALLSTLGDVRTCGAALAGFASLIAQDGATERLGAVHGVPFYALATLARALWGPDECPQCRSGVPFGALARH